jgi:hypothetical protein
MLVLRHLAICDAGESLKIQTDRKWKHYPH